MAMLGMDVFSLLVGFIAWLLPLLASNRLVANAAPLSLKGPAAIVWLEGPMGRSLSVTLLQNCYLADPSQRPLPVVCLD